MNLLPANPLLLSREADTSVHLQFPFADQPFERRTKFRSDTIRLASAPNRLGSPNKFPKSGEIIFGEINNHCVDVCHRYSGGSVRFPFNGMGSLVTPQALIRQ